MVNIAIIQKRQKTAMGYGRMEFYSRRKLSKRACKSASASVGEGAPLPPFPPDPPATAAA